MPYVIFFSSALLYYTFFLRPTMDFSWFFYLLALSLRILVIANLLIFEFLEIMQCRGMGFKEYIAEFWNQIDQIAFFLNAITLILHAAGADVQYQKTFGAISIFFLYVKFFYWLRLFEGTAAFIRMLREIVVDIIPFLTFLVVCVAMFANTMLLFDQSRRLQGIDAPINDTVYGIPFIDAFVRSYLIGLGEFGMDNFGE